jgi:hypothetical protein
MGVVKKIETTTTTSNKLVARIKRKGKKSFEQTKILKGKEDNPNGRQKTK